MPALGSQDFSVTGVRSQQPDFQWTRKPLSPQDQLAAFDSKNGHQSLPRLSGLKASLSGFGRRGSNLASADQKANPRFSGRLAKCFW